jgi:hypothetical protein
MRFLKHGAGRWAVPAVLAAVLAAALLITPVIAGTNGISGKKVNKTIAKKTNVTELAIPGVRNVGTGSTTLGSLSLSQGNYLVTSSFDARRNSVAENISCQLTVGGVGQDQSNSFTGTGVTSAEDSVALQVAGRATAATTVTLTCSSTAGTGQVNHAEITALKVPAVKVVG